MCQESLFNLRNGLNLLKTLKLLGLEMFTLPSERALLATELDNSMVHVLSYLQVKENS